MKLHGSAALSRRLWQRYAPAWLSLALAHLASAH
jgi:hypothetical protein